MSNQEQSRKIKNCKFNKMSAHVNFSGLWEYLNT